MDCVPWIIDEGCCEEWDNFPSDMLDRAERLAWSTMRVLTGGQLGSCPVLMRPCLSAPCDWCRGHWLNPMIVDGRWVNQVCGTPDCWCERLCEIVAPGPVAAITEVRMDGITLDPSLFAIHNGYRIVRTDGECFPSCQRVDRPLTEPWTLGIAYVPGIVPDAAGLWAAGILTCEFAKACSGAKCRLPASVTTISRQGVTFDMVQGMFPGGLTGIREVDAYITAINPHALKMPSTVWSPDGAWSKHRYETWPGVPAPSLPTIAMFDPAALTTGAGIQTVQVYGVGFTPTTVVLAGETVAPTSYVDGSHLTAAVTVPDLPGAVSVRVTDGSYVSPPMLLPVMEPPPPDPEPEP